MAKVGIVCNQVLQNFLVNWQDQMEVKLHSRTTHGTTEVRVRGKPGPDLDFTVTCFTSLCNPLSPRNLDSHITISCESNDNVNVWQKKNWLHTCWSFLSWSFTCVCSCSSSSCGSRDGCLRRRMRQLSEASGPAASSPHPLCPPGWARSLGSGDLETRHFLYRCLLHLTRQKKAIAQILSQMIKKKDFEGGKFKVSDTACLLTLFIHVIWYPTKCTYCLRIRRVRSQKD